jgi:hypothetical protein
MTTTTVDPPGTTTAAATDAMDVDLDTKKPAAEEDNGGIGTSMHSTASATAGTPNMFEDSTEEDDTEEALFLDIEKQEEATEDGDAKPTGPEEAPTLLKAALKKGELANGDAVGKPSDVAKADDAEAPTSTATNAAEAKVRNNDAINDAYHSPILYFILWQTLFRCWQQTTGEPARLFALEGIGVFQLHRQ